VLSQIPPRPFTYPAHRELFGRYTGITFDAISPAVTAADITVSLLLQPERAARLVEQHALDPSLPDLAGVLERLVAATFDPRPADSYQAEIARAVQRVVVEEMEQLAATAEMPQVRAIAALELRQLAQRAQQATAQGDVAQRAHLGLLAADIGRFLERSYDPTTHPQPLAPPPGSPIGSDAPDQLPR